MNKLTKFINYKFESLDSKSITMYFSLLILNVAIIAIFFFLGGVHFYFDHMSMVYLCLLMILLMLAVNILINLNYYEPSFYLMLLLVMFYIFMKIEILGSRTNVHILILYFVVPQFTYNFKTSKKIFINLVIFLVILISTFIRTETLSVDLYEQSIIFAKINIFLLYIILLLQLSSKTVITKFIDKIKDNELEFFKNKSQFDELTALGNRFYVEKYFEEIYIKNDKAEYVLAFVDIDDFKKINDTYGHIFGDVILKEVGSVAKKQFRKKDLISRWGGEEFLIVLEDVSLEKAEELLNGFKTNIKQIRVAYGEIEVGLTVTIGVSKVVKKDFEKAMAIADDNLYKGKKSGKDIVVV